MEIRTSTVAVVAASCITVGAAGAFLATRSSGTGPQPVPAAAVAPGGVEQSEGVVADAPVEPASTVTPASGSALAPVAPAAKPRVESPRPAPAPVKSTPPPVKSAPARGQSAPRAAESPRPAIADSRTIATPPTTSIEPKVTQPKPIQPAAESVAPLAPPPPPAPRYVDLVVAPDSVLGLQMETSISSDKAQVEDQVTARVTRDVRVGDRVAIPAGSTARGEVTTVERGGKVKERARLGIRFTSVVLADGTRVPIETETIYREGDSPAGESAAKIGGGAIGGAIIGGIFGGAKGAAIGASVGGGAGTAAVMAGGRNPATLSSGTPVTVRVVKPATVTVEE
jgi:hypothetical protein